MHAELLVIAINNSETFLSRYNSSCCNDDSLRFVLKMKEMIMHSTDLLACNPFAF